MTYLDTGTLALADILAAADDEEPLWDLAEEAAEDERGIRSHRRDKTAHRRPRNRVVSWGVKATGMAAAITVGALVFAAHGGAPGTANAASPFKDPTWQAMVVAGGWTCTDQMPTDRLAACTGTNGESARAEEYDGPDEKQFILIYTVGSALHRDILRVAANPAAAARIESAAKTTPGAYPNLRTGPGWAVFGTDPGLIDLTTSTTAAQPSLIPSTAPTATPTPTTMSHAPRVRHRPHHSATPTTTPTAAPTEPPALADVPSALRQMLVAQVSAQVRHVLGLPARLVKAVAGSKVHTVKVGKGSATMIVVPVTARPKPVKAVPASTPAPAPAATAPAVAAPPADVDPPAVVDTPAPTDPAPTDAPAADQGQ
jgi:hypothetical protein